MFYLYILLIIYYTLGVANFIYIAKFKTKYNNKTIRCVPTVNKRKNKINNYRLDIPLLGNNNSNSSSSLNKSSEDLSVNSDNYDNGQDPNKILELKEKRVSFNTNNINQNLNNLEDESLENHFY